jgi:N-dimethylarginine dimethylaminohydrolase
MEDDQSIDFLLLMEPPQDGTWWADGPGGYGGDEQAQDALTRGKVPNQAVVREEFDLFERALGNAGIMYGVMPYPTDLDGRVNGDAVFVRDHAVVDRHARKFLAAHFNDQAAARQAEVPYTCRVLQALGLEPIHYEKSPEVRIEGGEVVHGLLPSGKPFLITGVYRNTDMGNKMIQEMFGVHPEDHLVIETDAFHVDTSGFAVERRVNGTAVRLRPRCI